MKINLPRPDELQIHSVEEAANIIKLLLLKIEEMEAREPVRDQGLVEEIIHLRQETRKGFDSLQQETREGLNSLQQETKQSLQKLEDKMDENTLAIKALDKRFEGLDKRFEGLDKRFDGLDKRFESLDTTMKGGFDNVGKILQEISNKLDKP